MTSINAFGRVAANIEQKARVIRARPLIPNPKPDNVSSRLDSLLGNNRCILYGVQNGACAKPPAAVLDMKQKTMKASTGITLPTPHALPNERPETVSARIDKVIGESHMLRCLFYGVQEDASMTRTATTTVDAEDLASHDKPAKSANHFIKTPANTDGIRAMTHEHHHGVFEQLGVAISRLVQCGAKIDAEKIANPVDEEKVDKDEKGEKEERTEEEETSGEKKVGRDAQEEEILNDLPLWLRFPMG